MGDVEEEKHGAVAGGPAFLAPVRKWFKMNERGTTFTTELKAGTATFLTMCYIITVNASLLSNSGGPCPDDRKVTYRGVESTCDVGAASGADGSIPAGFFNDPTGCYAECVSDVRKQLITTTAVAAFLASTLMGAFANLPFVLAPGMGLNAYFTYDVVGFMGGGDIKWKTAITAVFIEGIIFMALAVSGLRLKFAKMIPNCIRLSTTAGIGFFLAHIGLQTAEGIGLVVADIATAVTLGGCPLEKRNPAYFCEPGFGPPTNGPVPAGPDSWNDYMFPFDPKLRGCIPASYEQADGSFVTETCEKNTVHAICLSEPGVYTCDTYGGKMTSPTMWLVGGEGIIGFFVMSILLAKKKSAALIVGVALITFISWIRGSDVSYFEESVYGGGEARYDYFKKVVNVEGISLIGGQLDFSGFSDGSLWLAIFTFLYVDLLDTTATLFAMAKYAGLMDEHGNFEGQDRAFIVDGFMTSVGALMGTSPVTTYIESAPGIEAGGKTGLTAIFCGFYFLLCIFFAPILASVPPWATGPALILVGAMMMKGVIKVDWEDYREAVPAFCCMIIMPLTYSIAYGIIAGLFSYAAINIPLFLWDLKTGEASWPPKYITDLQTPPAKDVTDE